MGLDVEHEVGRRALHPQLRQPPRGQGVVGRVDLHDREPRRVVTGAAPRPCRRPRGRTRRRRSSSGRSRTPSRRGRGGPPGRRAARWRPRRSRRPRGARARVRARVVDRVEVLGDACSSGSTRPGGRGTGAAWRTRHGTASLAGAGPLGEHRPVGALVLVDHPHRRKRSSVISRIRRRSSSGIRSTARTASPTSSTMNPVTPCSIVSVRPGAAGDHRRPGRHRLDRHQPERLRPAAEHHRRQGTRVQRVALAGRPRPGTPPRPRRWRAGRPPRSARAPRRTAPSRRPAAACPSPG